MMEKPKPSSGSESPVVQQAQGGTATDDREAEIARRLAALGEAAVNNIEEKEEELEEEEEAPMEVEEEEEVEPEVIEVEEPEEMAAPEKPAEIPAPPVPAPAPAPVPVMEAKKPDPVPVVASPATNNKSALLVSHCMFSQLLLVVHCALSVKYERHDPLFFLASGLRIQLNSFHSTRNVFNI